MDRLPFVDLAAQRTTLNGELEQACLTALARGDYILGTDVAAFEEDFARYCEVKRAVGVDSGTSALELALRAVGVRPGDEVITAANTFIATTFAIVHAGARPVLVDVDEDTYTIDVTQVEAAITPRTRAIVPVHLYGQCADMAALRDIAVAHDLRIVDDAAQAHGARHRGRRAGSLADAAAFSFYPAKNLGAAGDGGMVVTDDEELAERVRLLRNYGAREKYHADTLGYNRRLDTIQAAILRTKLPRLDSWNASRRAHAIRYAESLAPLGVPAPVPHPDNEHVWHLYVVRVPERDRLRTWLGSHGIDTGIHYPVPVHLQAAHSDLGYRRGGFPVTEAYAREILSLPMYPELPENAPLRVSDALAAGLSELRVGSRLRARWQHSSRDEAGAVRAPVTRAADWRTDGTQRA